MIALIDSILKSDAARRNGWQKVDVIAHSMGGYLLRYAALKDAPIDKAIFLASPHFGSGEAYVTLHPSFDPQTKSPTVFETFGGDPLASKVTALFGEELRKQLRDLARMFPSIYQLLFDTRYLRQRSLIPGVTGSDATYFVDANGLKQPWNFPDDSDLV